MTVERNFFHVARICVGVRRLFATVTTVYVGAVPMPGPVIYVANHRSFFDIPIGLEFYLRHGIAPQIAVHHRFFANRFLGGMLRYVGAEPLGKGLGEPWLASASTTLDQGGAVALMPQGRITTASDRRTGIGTLKSGVFRLARTTGAPVVPIGAVGTNEIWPLGRRLPRFRLRRPTVRVCVGEAMFVDDLGPDEFMSALTDRITALVDAP